MTEKLDFQCELKALEDSAAPGSFEGYASVFGDKDFMSDIVARGAFKRTLREFKKLGRVPALLWQHDTREPIGLWTEVREDQHGLYVKGQLFIHDIAKARQAHVLLKSGGLSGLSIGFRTVESIIDDKKGTRTLTDVDLYEISLVTFPALDSARVANVKASDISTIREFEDFLRDVGGFSHAAAKAIAAGGFNERPHARDERGKSEPRDEDGDEWLKAQTARFADLRNPERGEDHGTKRRQSPD